jgi:hypothetical protein
MRAFYSASPQPLPVCIDNHIAKANRPTIVCPAVSKRCSIHRHHDAQCRHGATSDRPAASFEDARGHGNMTHPANKAQQWHLNSAPSCRHTRRSDLIITTPPPPKPSYLSALQRSKRQPVIDTWSQSLVTIPPPCASIRSDMDFYPSVPCSIQCSMRITSSE